MKSMQRYLEAGVDLAIATQVTAHLRTRVGDSGLLRGIGGFAAAARLPAGMRDPVVVTACDGVGTKLELLAEHGRLDVAGRDLVAMCVNDLACCGATPWLLLDYYGCAKLEHDIVTTVLDGIVAACADAGCELAGGEIAELPGLLAAGRCDLAGFALGLVEADRMLDPATVQDGDMIVGLRTQGLHCNGFALVRKVIHTTDVDLGELLDGVSLATRLLAPTPLYVAAIAAAMDAKIALRAVAHITGGGLPGNLPRALPVGLGARLELAALPQPKLHTWLQLAGGLDAEEMRTVFNAGIGMALVVTATDATRLVACMTAAGFVAAPIGTVVAGSGVEFV